MTNSSAHENAISNTVVCFMFDGSQKYASMTLNAINSFINTTPRIAVGLLVPVNFDVKPVLASINDPSRIRVRNYSAKFANWNPTQYKLDIQRFSDEFDSIWWLDSDALVYKDLTQTFVEFYNSPCTLAFLKDHVCFNPAFLASWFEFRHKAEPFVPQACFMGFKKSVINEFFNKWESCWRQWIEPRPFYNFPDPLPSFAGSAFCTEQYALGVVLENENSDNIYVIQRITFPLRGVAANSTELAGFTNSSFSASFNFGSFSMTNQQLAENQINLLNNSFSSFGLTSFSGASYGGVNFGGQTSAGLFSGPYLQFSGPAFSGQVFSGPFIGGSFSAEQGSFTGLSFGGSFTGGSFTGAQASFSSFGDLSSAGLSSYSGPSSFSSSAPVFFVPVDNIAGGIVHFYSTFYEQSHKWWEQNKVEVTPKLDEYWKSH